MFRERGHHFNGSKIEVIKKYIITKNIPNGYLDAYEVKVNKDTFKYQAKVK